MAAVDDDAYTPWNTKKHYIHTVATRIRTLLAIAVSTNKIISAIPFLLTPTPTHHQYPKPPTRHLQTSIGPSSTQPHLPATTTSPHNLETQNHRVHLSARPYHEPQHHVHPTQMLRPKRKGEKLATASKCHNVTCRKYHRRSSCHGTAKLDGRLDLEDASVSRATSRVTGVGRHLRGGSLAHLAHLAHPVNKKILRAFSGVQAGSLRRVHKLHYSHMVIR
jgi:hypothetical protein